MGEDKNIPSLIKIPSKTFLMGEYSVLIGGRALVMAHAPFFEFGDGHKKVSFHKDSPAGKISEDKEFSFLDPYSGAGGFGGSTAEFLGVQLQKNPGARRSELMQSYLSLFEDDGVPPSGADLCAQSFLKECVVEYKKDPLSVFTHQWPFSNLRVLIFKSDRKVKTHSHLNELCMKQLGELANASEEAVEAFVSGDLKAFISFVDEFTKEQAIRGLLESSTMRLIVSLNKIDGVRTSRGCGAMGADVVSVFVNAGSEEYVLSEVENMNLGLEFINTFGGC